MEITIDCPSLFDANSKLTSNGRKILLSCRQVLKGNAKSDLPPLQRTGNLVTFDLLSTFTPVSNPVKNGYALQALLHCLVGINIDYLRKNPNTPNLYDSGVYYKRTDVWDSIPALYARGYGDCKSLSCALVAERVVKEQRKARPVYRWVVMANDKTPYHLFYHILVLSDVGWEDPSKVLGMLDNETSYFQTNKTR